MITYADLEKTLRIEKSSSTLSPIEKDFYEGAKELLRAPEAAEYVQAITQLLEDIYDTRINKIVHYAGRAREGSRSPENILDTEKDLYTQLLSEVSKNRSNLLAQKPPQTPVVETPKMRVRIITPLPKIVGSDMVEYGPFKAEEVVELPKASAELLISRNAVEKA